MEFKADIAAQDIRRDQMPREAHSKGLPALHWAAIRGHNGVIDTLLEANARIDMRDSQKQTPLHRAVMFGPNTAVQHLIQCKADVNASDCYQRTPRDLAVRPEITQLLACSSAVQEERKQVVMRKIVARMVQRILSHALTSGWFSLGQLNLN